MCETDSQRIPHRQPHTYFSDEFYPSAPAISVLSFSYFSPSRSISYPILPSLHPFSFGFQPPHFNTTVLGGTDHLSTHPYPCASVLDLRGCAVHLCLSLVTMGGGGGRDVAQGVEHSAVKVWILLHGRSILHGR